MNLTNLTNYINDLQRRAQTQANQNRIPGAADLETQSSENIGSELRGQVDPETLRVLGQQAAERGVRTGIDSSSPNANAAYLQALGLTGIQLQQQGQRDLTAAYARNPAAPLFDPATQLMTPYQAGTLDLEAQRLALEASRRGGGGGGTGYTGEPGGPVMPTTRTGTTGATASDLLSSFAPDATEAWWNSIGFRPGTGGVPGTGTTTIDQFGPDEGYFDFLDTPSGGGSSNTITGYGDLFPDSLYG
jgi:hypothetical protein